MKDGQPYYGHHSVAHPDASVISSKNLVRDDFIGGHMTVHHLKKIVKEESRLPYSLAKANCQHFAKDVYNYFSGANLSTADMPNGYSMSFASKFWDPSLSELASTVPEAMGTFTETIVGAFRDSPLAATVSLLA